MHINDFLFEFRHKSFFVHKGGYFLKGNDFDSNRKVFLLIVTKKDLSERSFSNHLFFIVDVVGWFDFGYFHKLKTGVNKRNFILLRR